MPLIITNKFRLNNAEQFSESFSETANNVYYLGIGRPQPFDTLTRVIVEQITKYRHKSNHTCDTLLENFTHMTT